MVQRNIHLRHHKAIMKLDESNLYRLIALMAWILQKVKRVPP